CVPEAVPLPGSDMDTFLVDHLLLEGIEGVVGGSGDVVSAGVTLTRSFDKVQGRQVVGVAIASLNDPYQTRLIHLQSGEDSTAYGAVYAVTLSYNLDAVVANNTPMITITLDDVDPGTFPVSGAVLKSLLLSKLPPIAPITLDMKPLNDLLLEMVSVIK